MAKQRDLKHRSPTKARRSYTTAREHTLRAQRELTTDTDQQRVRAVVLRCMNPACGSACSQNNPSEEREVTLRTSGHVSWTTAPGRFVQARVERR